MSEHLLFNGRVVVLDDLLTLADLDCLLASLDQTRFASINVRSAPIWRSNFPLNPQIGDQIVALETHPWMLSNRVAGESEGTRHVLPPVQDLIACSGAKLYPTRSPLDQIIDAAVEAARRHNLFSSQPSSNPYAACFATLYQYGPGTRLAWHNDRDYLGAFAAYLTPDWSENQGGYLAVQEGTHQREIGVAQIIEPRCNRVIVFAPGVRHSVLSVAEDTTRPRLSLSGFFVSRSQLGSVLATQIGNYLRKKQPVAL